MDVSREISIFFTKYPNKNTIFCFYENIEILDLDFK